MTSRHNRQPVTNLLALLARQGKTYKNVADVLNISENVANSKLTGKKSFSLHEILTLADYFNVSMDYIAGRGRLIDDAEK